ncbi:tetratricopeptide repeat protein [Algibacillus agarilyticus]|uniref:tetratricopeptide repeat protein n=1 Tax=Algibacillus agarilyticus TaxID=2234133 RepID=UPI000DD02BD3|nr:SEL1-like repeat protein [Algibacillus agarilyticus]
MKLNKSLPLVLGLLSGFNCQADMLAAHEAAQEKNYTVAAPHFKKSADLGLAKAQSSISQLYLYGAGVAKDPILSFTYMALAYDQTKSADLKTKMSAIYHSLSKNDQQTALEQYDEYSLKIGKDALVNNILPAIKTKPFVLRPGKKKEGPSSVSHSVFSTVKLKLASAILEYDIAPDGSVRDVILAHDFFATDALKDSMIRSTYSIKFKPKKAKVYKKFNIEQQRSVWAQTEISKGYLQTESPKFHKRIKMLEGLAKKGNANALYELGMYYVAFPALNTNRIKTVAYMEQAAKLGHPKACTEYAYYLFKGKGVKKDFKLGVEYLTLAAQSGDARAQYRLGRELFSGQIVERDHNKASFWFTQAVEGQNENAKFWLARSILSKKNSDKAQIKQAHELLKQVKDAQYINPNWHYYLAKAYFMQNNNAKGRELLMDAIKRAEAFEWQVDDWKKQLSDLNKAA